VSRKPMSLKKLAEHLGLSPATVSLVINRSIVADSIPRRQRTGFLRLPVSSNIAPIFLHELCATAQLHHWGHRPGGQRRLFVVSNERH
jgi:hypothetical protein